MDPPMDRQKRSRSPTGGEGLPTGGGEAADSTLNKESKPAVSSGMGAAGAKLLQDAKKKERDINLKESLVQLVITSKVAAPSAGGNNNGLSGNTVVGEIKWLITDFTVRELEADSSASAPKPLYLTELTVPEACKSVSNNTGAETAAEVTLEGIVSSFTPLFNEHGTAPTPATEDKSAATSEHVNPCLPVDEDLQQFFNMAETSTKGASHVFSRLFGTKEARTAVHKQVRATMGLFYESTTLNDGNNNRIKVTFLGAKGEKAFNQRNRRSRWPEGRGEYLHFTAYKENIDSSSMLRTLATKLNLAQKSIQFSGTKDKRGVTLQRLCIHKAECERVAGLNNVGFGRNSTVKLGNFEYKKEGLSLGKLKGNFFSIIIRQLEQIVEGGEGGGSTTTTTRPMTSEEAAAYGAQMADVLSRHGFINYFGPQRFGTTSVATSTVGCALLAKKYRDVVMMCLQSKSEFAPDVKNAIALAEQDQWAEALAALPHFCFQERDMLQALVRNPKDFAGAISAIPRPITMLFCHSVQSLCWNEMASRRIKLNCLKPVEGDLVFANSALDDSGPVVEDEDEDLSGFGGEFKGLPAVHVVTKEDVASDRFSLSQVVLPVPGPDSQLQFPVGDETNISSGCDKEGYQKYLDEIGASSLLDTDQEGTALTKKFHFHGTYRKLVTIPLKPHGVQVAVKRVSALSTPCVDTDLLQLNRITPPTGGNKRERKKERKIAEKTAAVTAAASGDNNGDDAPSKKDEGEGVKEEEEADAVPSPAAALTVAGGFEEPPEGEGLAVLEVSFALGAGSYATSLLREMVSLVRSS